MEQTTQEGSSCPDHLLTTRPEILPRQVFPWEPCLQSTGALAGEATCQAWGADYTVGLGGRSWFQPLPCCCASELLSCAASCVHPMEFQKMEPTCFQSGFTVAASSALQLAGEPVALSPQLLSTRG